MMNSLNQSNQISMKYTRTDVENIVQAIYKLILDRNADPSGLKNYSDFISNQNSLISFVKVLDEFINSEEYNDLLIRKYRNEYNKNLDIHSNTNSIQHVISLGTHCLSSYF